MSHIIQTVFQKPHVLLPVVHAMREEQALSQAEIALKQGADGVFFINQGGDMSIRELLVMAARFAKLSSTFVGVNQLSFARELERLDGIQGLWTDDLVKADPHVVYFGGVAFKYQPEIAPEHLAQEVERALAFTRLDVLTTSGTATGSAPDISKILAIREVLGENRALAIASGVAAENVEQFLPHVQAFLVASSLEAKFGCFEPSKIKELADLIHQN